MNNFFFKQFSILHKKGYHMKFNIVLKSFLLFILISIMVVTTTLLKITEIYLAQQDGKSALRMVDTKTINHLKVSKLDPD